MSSVLLIFAGTWKLYGAYDNGQFSAADRQEKTYSSEDYPVPTVIPSPSLSSIQPTDATCLSEFYDFLSITC